nr:MAG TPA: hypothetical protein [Bacteriophage sp.]
MPEGVTAYDANGNLISGTVTEIKSGDEWENIKPQIPQMATVSQSTYGGNTVVATSIFIGGDILARQGGRIITPIYANKYGNATASDVMAGKTFTSSAGFKVVGTANTAPSAFVSAVTTDGTAGVWINALNSQGVEVPDLSTGNEWAEFPAGTVLVYLSNTCQEAQIIWDATTTSSSQWKLLSIVKKMANSYTNVLNIHGYKYATPVILPSGHSYIFLGPTGAFG